MVPAGAAMDFEPLSPLGQHRMMRVGITLTIGLFYHVKLLCPNMNGDASATKNGIQEVHWADPSYPMRAINIILRIKVSPNAICSANQF